MRAVIENIECLLIWKVKNNKIECKIGSKHKKPINI